MAAGLAKLDTTSAKWKQLRGDKKNPQGIHKKKQKRRKIGKKKGTRDVRNETGAVFPCFAVSLWWFLANFDLGLLRLAMLE